MYDEIYYTINELVFGGSETIFGFLLSDILASIACMFIVLVPFLIVWLTIKMIVRAFQ